jgi:hypothetical protein
MWEAFASIGLFFAALREMSRERKLKTRSHFFLALMHGCKN